MSRTVDPRDSALTAVLEGASLPIIVLALMMTGIFAIGFSDPPSFNTDLTTFMPPSDDDVMINSVEEQLFETGVPFYVHVTSDDGGNALDWNAVLEQAEILSQMEQESELRSSLILSNISAPGILQLALDETESDTILSDFDDWASYLNETVDEGTTCADGANEDLRNAASLGRMALVHKDLDYDAICTWLEDKNQPDPVPYANSTLWILEIRNQQDTTSQVMAEVQLRNFFNQASEENNLRFQSLSDGLISDELNRESLSQLVVLLGISILLVVIILAAAFRSIRFVGFPLAALTASLIWTYGLLDVLEMEYTILTIAVAPVVLGLGIDYSIHLQRTYERNRTNGLGPAEAWVASFRELRIALTLAVFTTVCAFIANIASPLPPVQEFGLALAVGVTSAFIASTVVVGALHVVVSRWSEAPANNSSRRRLFEGDAKNITEFQKKTAAQVLVAVLLITIGSVGYSSIKLETQFDLTDFLSEEMDTMQSRTAMYESYESSTWKEVSILIVNQTGTDKIVDDSEFLDGLWILDMQIQSTRGVVVPSSFFVDANPSYDGPYPIVRDAVQADSLFGQKYNLTIYSGRLTGTENYVTGDFANALSELATNTSSSSSFRGLSYEERVGRSIVFTQNGEIAASKIRIDVEAESSTESREIIRDITNVIDKDDIKNNIDAQIILTGYLVKLEYVLDSLSTSQISSTILSLVVSFLVLLLLTRRIAPSFIVIVPVALAAVWVVGSMAVLGIHWNVLTVMVTALTIGLGIDYTIHMWRKYESLIENDVQPWEALRKTNSTTGAALCLSAMTTAIGFLVLWFSPMPVVRDFGIVTALTVIFSLTMALILLPLLLVYQAQSKTEGDNLQE
ncbi:MAG: MMPL family transporter [Candidatus Thermoplasmatota archaeon]|nr:MMPL family transporter [Candidatus Thermoplasmatota archaeon]